MRQLGFGLLRLSFDACESYQGAVSPELVVSAQCQKDARHNLRILFKPVM